MVSPEPTDFVSFPLNKGFIFGRFPEGVIIGVIYVFFNPNKLRLFTIKLCYLNKVNNNHKTKIKNEKYVI